MSSHPDLKPDTPVEPGPPSQGRGHRRTWAAVIAVVAVLAVVAAAYAIGRLSGGESAGPGTEPSVTVPTSTSPSTPTSTSASSGTSTSSTPSTHQPPAGVLDVTNLPTGSAPAIGYLDHGVARLPDGTSVRPGTQFTPYSFAQLADDSIAYLTQHGGGMAVEIVTPDGVRHGPYRSLYDMVVNADHSVVVWLSARGTPVAWQPGLTEPVTFRSASSRFERLAAVTGTDCTTPTGCRVFASSWVGNHPYAWALTPDGTLTRADSLHRLVAVHDATDSGLLVGYLRITDTGSTSGVINEAGAGHPLMWQTSRYTLDSFSPDQRYLLAGPAYRDGIGDSQVAIYSVGGHLMAQRQIPGSQPGFVSGAAWEDATHVLFTVHQAGRWSIVRMGVDGRLAYAVPPVAARWDHGPFQLEVTP